MNKINMLEDDNLDINKELEKNKVDKIICDEEINNYRNNFIKEITNIDVSDIKLFSDNSFHIKRNKPFNVKVRDFINKIKTVLFGDD